MKTKTSVPSRMFPTWCNGARLRKRMKKYGVRKDRYAGKRQLRREEQGEKTQAKEATT